MMDNKKQLEQMLNSLGIKYEKEYKFLKDRRFLFDYCIPSIKIAIEYEGIFACKSRHTSITGYTRDCYKYNRAALDGWEVYRFTAMDFQKKNVGLTYDMLKKVFKEYKPDADKQKLRSVLIDDLYKGREESDEILKEIFKEVKLDAKRKRSSK